MDVIDFLCVSLGSSTVQLHDSVGSRSACACSEDGFNSQNATVLEDCTIEDERPFTLFCGQKDSLQRIFIKKCFLFKVGSVCRVRRFTTRSRNSLTEVRKSQMMPEQVRKCLRQQSKTSMLWVSMHWYSGGTSVSMLVEDMSRNKYFSQVQISYVLYPFLTYLLTPPHIPTT
jgi:hypothetical protein